MNCCSGMVLLMYTLVRIKKSKNAHRNIYIPDVLLKKRLKDMEQKILLVYKKHVFKEVDHAFVKDRNCVSNALEHLLCQYTLSIDIEDFFESIKKFHLNGYFSSTFLDQALVNGRLVQGFSTSPMLANIAMIKVDKKIMEAVGSIGANVVYTRYADDLSFSFDDGNLSKLIYARVNAILAQHQLRINKKKTKLQNKANGRVIITGVAIDHYGVYPTRKTIKKIRAARHQSNEKSYQGLLEWSLCKLPNNFTDCS